MKLDQIKPLNERQTEKKESGLDPDVEKKLEGVLSSVAKIKDVEEAKKIAMNFIESMKFKEKFEKFKRGIQNATKVAQVQSTLYNIKLAGEGLGVVK